MTARAKIASAILFILVTIGYYYPGFTISNSVVACWLALIVSFGFLLIVATNVNVWLKLFLFGSIVSSVYAFKPVQAGVCLGGVIFCMGVYYYLSEFRPEELRFLLLTVATIAVIQAGWVVIKYLRLKGPHFYMFKDVCGTIGYRNMVALLLGSTLPLIVMYRKKFTVPVLFAIWICQSLTAFGAATISMGIFLLEKSKRYIIIMLVLFSFLGYFGITTFINNNGERGRLTVWKENVHIIKKSPLVGTGFNTGINLIVNLKGGVVSKRAHNVFLELTKDAGLITSVPLLGFIIFTFVKFFRSDKTRIQKAVFGTLCGFYTGMMFSFPERNIPMASIMVVVLAAYCRLVRRSI